MAQILDPAAERQHFAERLFQSINDAGLVLMVSIGHRTGLFDAMVELPPATSRQLAEYTGLSERYVREWLGAMFVGGVVEYEERTNAYWLPREHASSLTRAAGADNLAAVAQWIGLLGAVEDRVVEAFSHGRGVPYSEYGRFHEVMAEESAATVVAALDEHILPLAPGLVEQLERGIDVADIGCGSGRALLHLAERFPQSRFTGVDLGAEPVERAIVDAQSRNLSNIRFRQADAAVWQSPRGFDLVLAFDAIHDQADPARVLANIREALRPGGLFLMQDIAASSHVHCNRDLPSGPLVYTISCMHCMSVSLADGGAGLGAAWGKELALEMLGEAGFANVEVNELPHDLMNYYYVCRP